MPPITYPPDPRNSADIMATDAEGVTVRAANPAMVKYEEVPAASVASVVAATASTGSTLTLTGNVGSIPRNLSATSAGTAGDIKAIQVTATGKDIDGNDITETLPVFTENSGTTVVGNKAFVGPVSVSVPAHDGNGATTSIGVGSKLGLPYKQVGNGVLAAWLGGVREGTAPTVTASASDISLNTAALNSALNGTDVDILLAVV